MASVICLLLLVSPSLACLPGIPGLGGSSGGCCSSAQPACTNPCAAASAPVQAYQAPVGYAAAPFQAPIPAPAAFGPAPTAYVPAPAAFGSAPGPVYAGASQAFGAQYQPSLPQQQPIAAYEPAQAVPQQSAYVQEPVLRPSHTGYINGGQTVVQPAQQPEKYVNVAAEQVQPLPLYGQPVPVKVSNIIPASAIIVEKQVDVPSKAVLVESLPAGYGDEEVEEKVVVATTKKPIVKVVQAKQEVVAPVEVVAVPQVTVPQNQLNYRPAETTVQYVETTTTTAATTTTTASNVIVVVEQTAAPVDVSVVTVGAGPVAVEQEQNEAEYDQVSEEVTSEEEEVSEEVVEPTPQSPTAGGLDFKQVGQAEATQTIGTEYDDIDDSESEVSLPQPAAISIPAGPQQLIPAPGEPEKEATLDLAKVTAELAPEVTQGPWSTVHVPAPEDELIAAERAQTTAVPYVPVATPVSVPQVPVVVPEIAVVVTQTPAFVPEVVPQASVVVPQTPVVVPQTPVVVPQTPVVVPQTPVVVPQTPVVVPQTPVVVPQTPVVVPQTPVVVPQTPVVVPQTPVYVPQTPVVVPQTPVVVPQTPVVVPEVPVTVPVPQEPIAVSLPEVVSIPITDAYVTVPPTLVAVGEESIAVEESTTPITHPSSQTIPVAVEPIPASEDLSAEVDVAEEFSNGVEPVATASSKFVETVEEITETPETFPENSKEIETTGYKKTVKGAETVVVNQPIELNAYRKRYY